jgi:hypothetical protein
MTFAEFGAICGGFEDFHCPPKPDGGAPSVEAHKRAMGLI